MVFDVCVCDFDNGCKKFEEFCVCKVVCVVLLKCDVVLNVCVLFDDVLNGELNDMYSV